jgi:hypothetical protein
MPCFTNIKTVLIDFPVIEKVAAELGIKVEKHTTNSYTLSKGSEHITIERRAAGEPFFTKAYSGSSNWDEVLLPPLVQGYARAQLKAVFKKAGYTAAAGQKPNELQFISYK